MNNLAYEKEQDFARKDGSAGSKFSSSDYSSKLGPISENQRRGEELKDILSKNYDVSLERRKQLQVEMEQIEYLRYMNMKYLAASLVILDRLEEYKKELEYEGEVEDTYFEDYMYSLFTGPEFDYFMNKLVYEKSEDNPSYRALVKSILLSYCHKIFRWRTSLYR